MERTVEIKGITLLICNGNEPLPRQGGMERVTDALARGLKEKGINVSLLCRNQNRLGENYNPPCPLYFLPKDKPQDFIRNLVVEKGITHIIDQGEDDLIGKHGYFNNRPDFLNGIKLIAVQHSNPKAVIYNYRAVMYRHYDISAVGYVYNNWLLPIRKIHSIHVLKSRYRNITRHYDWLVTLSPSFIEDISLFSSKKGRCRFHSIPNMNTYCNIIKSKKENRVLFVGRLINNIKGTDKLLRIWESATRNMDSNWMLDIVGDGPDRVNLERQVHLLGLKNVEFHGFQDPTPFYEKSKIFCMTSTIEGFGMVLTESMQHGVVPIGFDSYSAIHDIITDNYDGFLIKPFDESAYSLRLRELMCDEKLIKKISKNAKESVKKFSIERVIEQWISFLTEK